MQKFEGHPENRIPLRGDAPEWVDATLTDARIITSCREALSKAQARITNSISLCPGSGWNAPSSPAELAIFERELRMAKDQYWAAIPWIGPGTPEDHGLKFNVHSALVRSRESKAGDKAVEQCVFYLECIDSARRRIVLGSGETPQVSRSSFGMGTTFLHLGEDMRVRRMVFSEEALFDVLAKAGNWEAEYPDWVGTLVSQNLIVCNLDERENLKIRLSNKNGLGMLSAPSNEVYILEFSPNDLGTPQVKVTPIGKI